MSELKLIDNNIIKFIDIEKESGTGLKKPQCTPKGPTISLNVFACKELELAKYTHCNISSLVDLKETNRLYFRFNSGETSRNNYLLLKGDIVRTGATISGTTTLMRKVPRFAALCRKKLKHRQIELKKCSKTGLWYLPLSPEFEIKADLSNLPNDACIYKILYNGNILNIGETKCLSRRIKEKLVQGMKIHQVYFSPMNTYTDDERMEWEAVHIENYVQEYGCLPPENHQSGRKNKI